MHRCLDIAGYQMGYQMGYLFSDWNHWWLNRLQEYNRVQFPGDSACLGTLLSSRPVSQTQHLFPMATKWPPDGHQIMATSGTGGAKLPPKKIHSGHRQRRMGSFTSFSWVVCGWIWVMDFHMGGELVGGTEFLIYQPQPWRTECDQMIGSAHDRKRSLLHPHVNTPG